MKTALITGINGQVGSYLAEHLLKDDYKVYGIIRRASSFNTQRINHLYDNSNLELIYGDLADASSLSSIIGDIKPDTFFHLGAQSITEDSILPILLFDGVHHLTFGELWKRQFKRNELRILDVDGVETEVLNISSKEVKAMGF